MKKMSVLGLLFMGLMSASAQAADWKVEITSFFEVTQKSRTAEVCGKVTGPADQLKDVRVQLTPDYQSSNAGHYTTVLDDAGRFCSVVVTFYGQVKAEAKVAGQLISRSVATDTQSLSFGR